MLARPRRWSIPLLSCLAIMLVAVLSGPASAAADYSTIKINEVRSDGTDTIELVNTGSAAVDISGLVLKDEKDVTPFTIPAGTTVDAGAFVVFVNPTDFAFGLGKGDSVRLFDGTTLLDTTTWPLDTHANTWGRCADGTGPFGVTAATFGGPNACVADPTKVRINEVRSNDAAGGADFVELINTGALPIDITGWKAIDADPAHTPIVFAPAGTTIAPGGYFGFEPDAAAITGHFGLGKGDSVTILQADGTSVVATYSWTSHRTPSFGRCPAGTGDFVENATATPGALNACPIPAGGQNIKINEVQSNPNPEDVIELINTGSTPVDISGYVLKDNDDTHSFSVPGGTTIAAGAVLAFNVNAAFGLGEGDSARLYAPAGETLIDSTTWPANTHAITWGRCPDGTGDFRMVTPTLGAANDCAPVDPASVITINEIESNGDTVGDWVELTNTGTSPVDVSGWKILDNEASHVTTPVVIPAGTTIAPGAFYSIYTESGQSPGFGLGGDDSATLLLPDGTTVVDTYAWTAHADATYARCPDGVGDFTGSTASTRGAANTCAGVDPGTGTGLKTAPWPGSQTVRTSDLETTFLQDLSGLAFDPEDPDVLWAAQNKLGTLFKLVRDGQNWVPATANNWGVGKTPTYTNGTGAPDTEGLTIGPDGFIYAASERNNADNKISRMSILRYDPDATGTTLTATDEWDLTGSIPAAGANLGLEGTTWIPDSFLTTGGFIDQSTGAAYKPSDYPLHGTGLYAVAVEATGAVHVFALDSSGGTSHLIATVASGFPNLADVTFDAERQRLWAVTDDTHDGKTSLLELKAGVFTVAEAYDRPVGMPNINNEGLAISPQSECVDGFKEVVWATDGDDDGHSLRSGTISCTAAPVDPVQPVVDTMAPYVRIAGVERNALYVGRTPKARCVSTDAGSGVASCRITEKVTPTRTTLTATAVDRAGNVGTATVSYRTLAYRVKGATYRGGKFLLQRGKAYSVVGTVKASGRVYGPVKAGASAKASKRLSNGRATVRIPRSARIGSTWKIQVKTGSTTHTIKVKVTK
jgi:hypothetical protein